MNLWSPEEFTARLREVGERSYHDKHPFHQLMNEGKLDPEQIRFWVANRFYYQKNIPVKDAIFLSRCPDRDVRRLWVQRIIDHDGRPGEIGGIEKWLRLGLACGLSREDLEEDRLLLPAVRYAVDAYVNLVATRPWVEAVASSLTELFAPSLMAVRLAAFEKHYRWIDLDALAYFRSRLIQAPRDSDHGLAVVIERCQTSQEQERAVAALAFKCDLLWAQLDAIYYHCVSPTRAQISPAPLSGNASDSGVPDRPALAPHARLRWDEVRNQYQLVYPEAVMELSESAAEIVKRCDGRTLSDLVADLRGQFGSDEIQADVREFLTELAGKGLVRDAAP